MFSIEILISVGGREWSGAFSDMCLTSESRAKFIESAVRFVQMNNLDSKTAETIYRFLSELNSETGQTIVVVTHDEHFAAETKRILHILDGQLSIDRTLR